MKIVESCIDHEISFYYIYYSALAVVDSLFLLRQFIYVSSVSKEYFHFVWASNIFCKFLEWLVPFALCTSSWILLAVTTERLVVVTWPLQAKVWCTRRTARLVIVVLVATFGTLWATIVIIHRGTSTGECDNSEYLAFLAEHGYMISLSLHTLIPTSALVVVSVFLAVRLSRVQHARATMGLAAAMPAEKKSEATNITKATATTMLVSVTYLLLTLPSAGYSTIQTFYGLDRTPVTYFVGSQCLRLRYINHGINFVLYLLGLPKVRAEIKKMFSCGKATLQDTTLMTSKVIGESTHASEVEVTEETKH